MSVLFVTNGFETIEVDTLAAAFTEIFDRNRKGPKYPYFVISENHQGITENPKCPNADLIGKALRLHNKFWTVINSFSESPNLMLVMVSEDDGSYLMSAGRIRKEVLYHIEDGEYKGNF